MRTVAFNGESLATGDAAIASFSQLSAVVDRWGVALPETSPALASSAGTDPTNTMPPPRPFA